MMKWIGLTNGVYVNLEDVKVVRVLETRAGKPPELIVYGSLDTEYTKDYFHVKHPFDVEKILKALDKESV